MLLKNWCSFGKQQKQQRASIFHKSKSSLGIYQLWIIWFGTQLPEEKNIIPKLRVQLNFHVF